MNKVLKEEDYVCQINGIIEADYFPDIKKMGLLSNLMEAEESGNNGVIQATKDLLNSKNCETHIGLDSFLARTTSEDNQSFMKIQEENSKMFSDKY